MKKLKKKNLRKWKKKNSLIPTKSTTKKQKEKIRIKETKKKYLTNGICWEKPKLIKNLT